MPLNDPGRGVLLALAEQPEAKAAVVVYGLPGEALVYARAVKSWLSEVRGVLPGRLFEVYGGPAYTRRLELWLVPPATPRPDGGAGVRRGGPHLEARAAFAFPAPEHL